MAERRLILAAFLAGAAWPAAAGAMPSEGEVEALVAAIGRSDVAGVRAAVGERVLRLTGGSDFVRLGAADLIAATSGCRHLRNAPVASDDSVFVDFICAGRPRDGVEEEEDPGVSMRVWHPRGGAGLAVSFQETGIQVRPITRPIAPPAPPHAPARKDR